ncbi:ankyrin repeat-containing protein [Corynebacterium mustelae]|uniref:Ankyrin repeat-containing protein n=1 Tax=Corynebacterium mustelae TaxID=571915 RepID=A0A0G3H0L3_9CORY|nr:ankyrin repeat domain-containing protein [Corynebacterium mustelae]AKK06300.1 ankyrin repeat-containing protein [Corynebacterium mustelae]
MTHYLFKAAGTGDCEKIRQRLAVGDAVDYRHKGTGRTCLVEAVIGGHKDAVELLLDEGADVDASCTALGWTGVMWAVEQGNLDVLQLLIARGADVNRVSEDELFGRSAAMLAAAQGKEQALKMLVAAGADLSYCDRRGHNAMQEAIEKGQDQCVAYLRQVGAPEPQEVPVEQPLPWPELSWDPAVLEPGFQLPEGVSPQQVVWSYIQSRYHWEVEANKRIDSDEEMSALDSELDRGVGIAKIHLTDKKRVYGGDSVGWPPEFSPSFTLMGVEQVKPSRVEVHVEDRTPDSVWGRYEWIFVCLKKGGQWRIDSAKKRLYGTVKYRTGYLT